MKKYITSLFVITCLCAGAQKTYTHVAFINATAHTGNGNIIERSLVVLNGRFLETVTSVTNIKLNPLAFDTVIDLSGMHIYPALINCNNVLGLHDAEAVRATVDFAETGQLNPHVRALIAYNTDNVIIPTIRTNGVLYTQATPRGGMISGSSSIMALSGWNWEDAVVKADDGIHVNFPRFSVKRNNEDDENASSEKKYSEEIYRLEKFFADAVAYAGTTGTDEKNLRFESMRTVLEGNANLYLHADKAKDLLAVISFSKKFSIRKPVIVGGKESYRVSAELKRSGIPVMLGRMHDLPDYADDDVDMVNRLPGLLMKDSVLFCLQIEGDMEAMNSRNLPFNAGATVPFGLTPEQALTAITLSPARILGLEKFLGSLEEGKLASFVVSRGDILDMRSNDVILAYISGAPVKLENRQTELYERYKNKYGIK